VVVRRRALIAGLVLLLGCEPGLQDSAAPQGLLDPSGLWPWPSWQLLEDDPTTPTGQRLALPWHALPSPHGAELFDPDRLALLDGFSVATPVVLPFADLDPASLPSLGAPSAAMDPSAAVQLIDLDTGTWLPCFAETDAHPAARGSSDQALIIRPMRAMAFGHRHAVALTHALRGSDGAPAPRPAAFAELLRGGGEPAMAAHYEDLFTELEALGLDRGQLVLAWDFTTGSQERAHGPLDAMLAAGRSALPAEPDHLPAYQLDLTYDDDAPSEPMLGGWRVAQGSVELPDFLDAQGLLVLDAQGQPTQQGEAEVKLLVFIPRSLRGAAPGSAPVLLVGPGLFTTAMSSLGATDDPDGVRALAEIMGAILVAGSWDGLGLDDQALALAAADRPAQLHGIADRLTASAAAWTALARLPRTAFADDPVFEASDGGSLVDPDRSHLLGLSLGAVQGAVVLANSEVLEYGVLHVGGGGWATILERSSVWHELEGVAERALPDPLERQLALAMSQLLWDPVDPLTHIDDLAGRSQLWQVAVGDEQLPNLASYALARSLELPLLDPAVYEVDGLELAVAPTGPGASALLQLDPGLGVPAEGNRPAQVSGAHEAIRRSAEVSAQIQAFFAEGQEGTIIHPCGDQPCEVGEAR
jgi:hypothetical protein